MKRMIVLMALAASILVMLPGISEARFQLRCFTSHFAQEDPIVAPGALSGHMHEFFGNESTGKDSTYSSMIAADTNCSTEDDTAAYWTPTLHKADGTVVPAKSLLIYYRGSKSGETTVAFPRDLRVISDKVALGAGSNDRIRVRFPSCWDGENLDSFDHRSHMAFEGGKGCPSTHPVSVPEIVEVFRYGRDITNLTLSSGGFATAHADFWNTWQQPALVALVDRCLQTSIDCGRIDS